MRNIQVMNQSALLNTCRRYRLTLKLLRKKVENNLDIVDTVYEKLREVFPEKDLMFLLTKYNEYILKAGKMAGELDMTQVIDEILWPSAVQDN